MAFAAFADFRVLPASHPDTKPSEVEAFSQTCNFGDLREVEDHHIVAKSSEGPLPNECRGTGDNREKNGFGASALFGGLTDSGETVRASCAPLQVPRL